MEGMWVCEVYITCTFGEKGYGSAGRVSVVDGYDYGEDEAGIAESYAAHKNGGLRAG